MGLDQYISKNVIAWLWYNPNFESPYGDIINKVCYIYPRFISNKGDYEIIDAKEDFPQYGRIEVRIHGGDSAEDVYRAHGSLVTIKINTNVVPNYSGNNMYSLKYNSQYGKENSEIWIERFNGKDFLQVIDIYSDINTIHESHTIEVPPYEIVTNYILLRNGAMIYGPFEYDIKEREMILRSLPEFQYSIGEYNTIEYNDSMSIIENQNDEETVILLPRNVLEEPSKCETSYDWISSKKLVDGFIETLKIGNTYTREQLRQIRDFVLERMKNNSDMQITEGRAERIKRLVLNLSTEDERTKSIVQYALEEEELKEILVQEAVKNHFELIQSKISEHESVRLRIEKLKNEEVQISKHLADLQAKKNEITFKDTSTNQAEIGRLSLEIETLKSKNEELSALIDTERTIEELQMECNKYISERDAARDNYKKQIVDNAELEKELEETLRRFSDKASVTAKALDSKLLDRVLRSVGGESFETMQTPFITTVLHEPIAREDIINRVVEYIRDIAHRNVEYNDVANYLICLSHGFITTFAGIPGTGKTSLCNILAKSLGLVTDDDQKRFIDIPVERGWTSHKDFIGYYNPLTKTMEKSNTDVFNAILQLDAECGSVEEPYDPEAIAPFIILLDEANLSPIEHYWAAFLRNCDYDSSASRDISLGGNDSYHLPDHLRFMATVNFDHTTEELSPRFLDRSWIITLDPSRIDDGVNEIPANYKDMISYASLQNAFGVSATDVIDEPIQNKWNAIQTIFRSEKCSLPIMPRNLKMVKNYCAIACKCMNRETPITKFAPLDYAFSQKILPTINGTGDNYKTLINELLKECTDQNMPLSAKHLKRMQRVAEGNMGFYQFFAR